MVDDTPATVPPDPTTVVEAPADSAAVEPPSSLDLWGRAQLLHRCFGEDDDEPHILRGLD